MTCCNERSEGKDPTPPVDRNKCAAEHTNCGSTTSTAEVSTALPACAPTEPL